MTPDQERRKRAELRAKLQSVVLELDAWLDRSTLGGPAEKQHSQVRRVVRQLRPLAQRVACVIEQPDAARRWPDLEEEVLDLHRVWGFFREKLALRRLPELAPYLLLADEYAVACYLPAQRAALATGSVHADQVREPPLVYLTTAASPFSVPRGESYAAEVGTEGLTSPTARLLVTRLPVPVIGVPWVQLQHLPEALVIGHEVGHLVLEEMVGVEVVRSRVRGALMPDADPNGDQGAARRRWAGWAQEAFADVYGALCGGAAYLTVLGDFLAGEDPDRAPRDAAYPPAGTRLRLVAAALRLAGEQVPDEIPAAAEDSPEHAVARALLHVAYPCFAAPLDHVVRPPGRGGSTPRELLQGWQPGTRDVRTLLAVAARAFAENPEEYLRSNAQSLVLDQARRIQEPGIRRAPDTAGADEATTDAADAAAVSDLYSLLTQHEPAAVGST